MDIAELYIKFLGILDILKPAYDPNTAQFQGMRIHRYTMDGDNWIELNGDHKTHGKWHIILVESKLPVQCNCMASPCAHPFPQAFSKKYLVAFPYTQPEIDSKAKMAAEWLDNSLYY